MATTTDIDFYTGATPNGHKISCTLEELGIKYNLHEIDISKNTQKEAWFLEINPNGRIPAIVDRTSGKSKRVFEGAAIQLYLCERYDKDHSISFPYDSDEYWETVEWMIWMQSGIGPMQGQANHFYRYAPTKIEYAINRYQTETRRLYQVLSDRLAAQKAAGKGLWLVGGKYSIADLCCFSWVNWAGWAGVSTQSFAELEQWAGEIEKRPAVQRGINIPQKFKLKEIMQDKKTEEEFQKMHSKWVMDGMQKDAEKHK